MINVAEFIENNISKKFMLKVAGQCKPIFVGSYQEFINSNLNIAPFCRKAVAKHGVGITVINLG